MERIIKQIVPHRIKIFVTKTYYTFCDVIDWFKGNKEEFTPRKGTRIYVGGGNFKAIGEKIVQELQKYCDLKPHESVLDVGCGIGRVAMPLTNYLNSQGSYEGFDIVPQGIEWCQKKISSRYPNFRFQVADVYNKTYYPKGKHQPSAYTFPYQDASFDVVFLTSVFTHMLPADLEQYFGEIIRVLKPGGRTLISYFLLHSESLQAIETGSSTVNLKNNFGFYRTKSTNVPEVAVGYDEPYILDLYKKYGMDIQKLFYGSWFGRKEDVSYQDLIIAQRK